MLVWSRGFMSWMLRMLPLLSMKAMLRGKIVFAIQKLSVVSCPKSNSIPASGGMLGRNIRPSSREGSSPATSTFIATFWPLLLVMLILMRLRLGAAVSVASAPGMGVPAKAVGGTQGVTAGGKVGVGVGTGACRSLLPVPELPH